MSNTLFDGLHNGLGRVLDLRMQQHSLTAANLANADTPGTRPSSFRSTRCSVRR